MAGGAALQRMWLRAELLGLGLQPLSPVFLYAHTESELAAQVGGRAPALFAMREAFRRYAGIEGPAQPVLTLRIVRGQRPTAISARESLDVLASSSSGLRYS